MKFKKDQLCHFNLITKKMVYHDKLIRAYKPTQVHQLEINKRKQKPSSKTQVQTK